MCVDVALYLATETGNRLTISIFQVMIYHGYELMEPRVRYLGSEAPKEELILQGLHSRTESQVD